MRTLFTIVLLVLATATASAQDGSVFTVPRVPVFAEAENAAAAQGIAQAQGRKVAMDILLRRLTAEEDWGYLPRLALGQGPNALAVPEGGEGGALLSTKQPVEVAASDLTRLELSFAPYDEKTSRTTYRAEVTYRFNPQAVRALLTDAGLPYSESQTRQALVLPVLETEGGVYLWEAKNPWARAWLSRPFENELTPLVLPRGNQQDTETLTAAEAKDLDQDALRTLAERYRAPQVLVALAKLTEKDGEQQLFVRLLDGYLDGRGDNRRRLESGESSGLYDAADGFGGGFSRGATRQSAGTPGQALAEAFFRAPEGDFPALAKRAVEASVSAYADDWKARTLVDHSAVREFRLTAWFEGLGEWAEIRQALEGTALVTGTETGAFTNENAVIQVTAIGQPAQFDLAMRQQGLAVWRARDGWHVADADRAPAIQARVRPLSAAEAAAADGPVRERRGGAGARRGFDAYEARDEGPEADAPDRSRVEAPDLPDDLFGEEPARLETEEDEDPFLGDY